MSLAKPTYDALTLSLLAHRAEMRFTRHFFSVYLGFPEAMQTKLVLLVCETAPQDLQHIFAPGPEPTYDELALSLCAHREEMRAIRSAMHLRGICGAQIAHLFRMLRHSAPQDLQYVLDPEESLVKV
jgi:hypothetical protein